MGATAKAMKTQAASVGNGAVLFFDGECGFCSRIVNRVARWDKAGVVQFAPLKGSTAKALLDKSQTQNADTVVLWSHGLTWERSTAMIKTMLVSGGFWGLCGSLLSLCPQSWRDAVYNMIASNRKSLGQCALNLDSARLLP